MSQNLHSDRRRRNGRSRDIEKGETHVSTCFVARVYVMSQLSDVLLGWTGTPLPPVGGVALKSPERRPLPLDVEPDDPLEM